jgi:hypothetical protein
MTYEAIAAELGYAGEAGPLKAVDRLLSRVEHERAEEMRTIEGHRLDQLQAAHWDAALRGDIDATKVMLQVIDRLCKQFGHNAPVAVRVGREITDVEFAEQAVELITSLASMSGLGDALRELGHAGRDAAAILDGEARTAVPEGKWTSATRYGPSADRTGPCTTRASGGRTSETHRAA